MAVPRLGFIAIFTAMALMVACDDDDNSDGVLAVRSGWVFNLCGSTYCQGELSITEQMSTFTAIDPNTGSNTPPLVVSEPTSAETWLAIKNEIHTLPDDNLVLGCPGCTDGGREWIEYDRSAATINILFSCGETLSGAEVIQTQLRAARDRLAATVGFGGVCMEPFRP